MATKDFENYLMQIGASGQAQNRIGTLQAGSQLATGLKTYYDKPKLERKKFYDQLIDKGWEPNKRDAETFKKMMAGEEIQGLEWGKGSAKTSAGSFNDYTTLRKEFTAQPVVKDFETVKSSYRKMNEALKHALAAGSTDTKAAADQALVVAFNKMIDPTSVVRESEYARTGEGQALLSQLEGFVSKVKQGGTGLTDQNRKDVVEVAKKLVKAANSDYLRQRKNYGTLASEFGMRPELVLGDNMSLEDMPKYYFDNAQEVEAAGLPIGTRIFMGGVEYTIEE